MPRQLPPHAYRETNRHGRTVWYFRVGKGRRTRIAGEFGSPQWEASYAAASAVQPARKGVQGAQEGTFAWGARLYLASQAWASLKPTTRQVRGNILKRIEEKHGQTRLASWRRAEVVAGRDARADRPAAARHFVDTLRGMFKHLVDVGIVAVDPTAGVQVARPRTDGHEPWTEADIAAFRKKWPLGTRERLAMEILYATGLRRGDAVRVGAPHLRDGVIRIKTEKTGEWVAIAMTQTLARAIAAGPCGELTWLASELTGRPLAKESFGNDFRAACNAAGVAKSAHGLRKAAATADALAGWSDAELDAKYGWTGRRMSSLYTRAASRERLSLNAAERTREKKS